MDYLYNI